MDFRYKARNAKGEVQTGIVKASDEDTALETLKKNSLDVFFLEPVQGKTLSFQLANLISRVSQKDLVVFSRQLSVLIESSVPIIRALRTLADQTENPRLEEVCRKLAISIEEGDAFSEALAKHPQHFDSFFVNVVKSGESSGNLERSLIYIADHLEKSYELRRKIQAAMMYPAVVLSAFVIIFFFLTIKVLPQLTEILKESSVALPWTTRVIIWVSDFMNAHWVATLIMIIGIIGGLIYYFRTDHGRKEFDILVLRIPIIGTIVQYAYVAKFAENLGVLLKEGVSIVRALAIMAEVMDNMVYRDLIVRIMQNVEKGKSIADAMIDDEEAFPRIVPQMIKVGEEAGRTPQILKNIENFYTKEVDNLTENMTSVIEPLLIIVLGIGTGILVAAIIMPIYDMAGSL